MNTPRSQPPSGPSQAASPTSPPDPLIDKVREARRQVDEQHGGDIRRLAAALRKLQQESGRRIISGRGTTVKRAG